MRVKSSIDEMVEASERELIEQYGKLVPLYPPGIPDAQFLVALWASSQEPPDPNIPLPPGENLELLKMTGPIITRRITLESIGFGWVIATYIANRLLWPKTRLSDAVPIAIYMIDEAKQHVKECGGDTHVVTLDERGEVISYSQEEIKERTKHFRAMDFFARQIVGLAMKDTLNDESYDALLADYLKQLNAIRKSKL
jgi:hypothetical protein